MAESLLQAQRLYKSFGRRKIIQDVSFVIPAGALVGIVGENGAGKTTLLRMLVGELRPNKGVITHRGALGYCPQTVNLNEMLTVDQHVEYFRAAYNLGDRRYADELIEQLGYQQYRRTLVGKLSGGTRQKLNLTLALMHHPTLLLLDEPYQGFDWETYLRFWELVANLRERGCSALIISHLFFEQKRFDMLYHLQKGQLQQAL